MKVFQTRWGIAICAALIALCALSVVAYKGNKGGPGSILTGNDGTATHTYVIKPGTFDAMATGQSIQVLPDDLQFKVGETIRIRNEDSKSGIVGPFFVDAHSTMTQKFTSAGTYQGMCNVHPSGRITIRVT